MKSQRKELFCPILCISVTLNKGHLKKTFPRLPWFRGTDLTGTISARAVVMV